MLNLTVRNKTTEDAIFLYLQGEIDVYTVPSLREQMLPLIEKEGQKVIVDLSGVHYIDSTGLGVFIGALKAAYKYNGSLEFTGMTERVQRLFSITGLDEIMQISEKQEESL